MESQGFTYLQQIAGVSIFQGNEGYKERSSKENVAKLKQILADKVLDIEQAYYIDPDLHSVLGGDYETERAEDDDERSFDDFDDDFDRSMFLTCSPYYDTGHGIDAVWENFDGYNITVAVVDIGVSVKHDELSAKIRIAHNFETNDENVEPEDYGIQYSQLTNHGNSAASVIGAVKDNKLCSAGVAYNANIAAFKIGSVSNTGDLKISVININAALAYKYNEIDIYSNSWDLGRRGFRNCGLSASAVLKAGVQKGRRGSGSIYMIATGKIGNCVSNSIYTIAVNSIGTNGSVPFGINRSSATLVSAFGQANNRTKYMITASQRADIKCDKNFKGSSSATAILAGICALILQAKPTLTWRDIQHILVQSSNAVELNNHKTNGAGRTCHDVFGFGIVNASKAIEIAKPWVMVDKQMNITKEFERFNASHFIAEIQCNNGCVQAIEHDQVAFNFN
ncbi:furin-1-like [Mya arenaria]|uniref:furin-1-like n=1 Tax=Mya arenaria TaxID=6604 RepID=UPI0022E6FDF5|nr:furin-1-like [Mya arenaria]